jgi:hypothetical protein
VPEDAPLHHKGVVGVDHRIVDLFADKPMDNSKNKLCDYCDYNYRAESDRPSLAGR